MKKLRY